MRRDYYAVLGITATAGTREIRRAYQQLARRYSPDVNLWDRQAETLFDEIAEAYRVLSDPVARALYDRFGHGAAAVGAGRRGEDLHAAVELSFAEAVRGRQLTLALQRYSPCDRCGAAGATAAGPCPACAGRGVRRAVDAVGVAIPAGVDSGHAIRIPGQGHAGPYGGPRGDLIVNTRVHEHPYFKRQGDAVHCQVPVSVWEALRGTRLRVPTPAGSAILVVPPGTRAGQVFRLPGHGVPRLSREGTGDLHVEVRVEMPAGLDPRADELVRELERLVPLSPREGLDRYAGGGA